MPSPYTRFDSDLRGATIQVIENCFPLRVEAKVRSALSVGAHPEISDELPVMRWHGGFSRQIKGRPAVPLRQPRRVLVAVELDPIETPARRLIDAAPYLNQIRAPTDLIFDLDLSRLYQL